MTKISRGNIQIVHCIYYTLCLFEIQRFVLFTTTTKTWLNKSYFVDIPKSMKICENLFGFKWDNLMYMRILRIMNPFNSIDGYKKAGGNNKIYSRKLIEDIFVEN